MNKFKIVEKSVVDELTKGQLFELWNREFPYKLSYKSLDEFNGYLLKLNNLTNFILLNEENIIEGWSFSFEREGERWFAIILSEQIQGLGLGRKMLDKLKNKEKELSGWVIDHNNDLKQNGTVYHSPLSFYLKCGFVILNDVRLELDTISAVKIKWYEDLAF